MVVFDFQNYPLKNKNTLCKVVLWQIREILFTSTSFTTQKVWSCIIKIQFVIAVVVRNLSRQLTLNSTSTLGPWWEMSWTTGSTTSSLQVSNCHHLNVVLPTLLNNCPSCSTSYIQAARKQEAKAWIRHWQLLQIALFIYLYCVAMYQRLILILKTYYYFDIDDTMHID